MSRNVLIHYRRSLSQLVVNKKMGGELFFSFWQVLWEDSDLCHFVSIQHNSAEKWGGGEI